MPIVPPQAPPPVATTQVAAAPVIDTEPDYKARYLNNPQPPYPIIARQRNWTGKVILNVEVLAEGRCGAVNVFRTSGHEVLDNAAIAAVKTWRFTPATRTGRAVTQWARVPVDFSLEDDEA
jgi:protein TonB